MDPIITVPELFNNLMNWGCISSDDVLCTDDGFFALFKSVSDILRAKGITHFLADNGSLVECDYFFDDWYIYAVNCDNQCTYSLFKLREQEYDSSQGGDGDTPGVTISFVEFNYNALLECLSSFSEQNTARLNKEIDRVVVYRKQKHNSALKKYFVNPASKGAYLVAELFVKHIASFACNGCIDVSEDYKKLYQNRLEGKNNRIPHFIDCVNRLCGYTVCDHNKIYIKDANKLTDYEKRVILAVNTANVSFSSFGAEVEFHARFLNQISKIRVPVIMDSPYESAIRADMTICDKELQGVTPYYNLNSWFVKRHEKIHGNI